MLGWIRKFFGKSSSPPRVLTDTSPSGVYSALRSSALATQRTKVGIPAPPVEAPIWGMLMEMGLSRATATLLAVMDGTTSLYLSTGGGVLGGHAHEPVRAANAAFLETANQLSRHLTPTTTFPVPETGQTVFYALTDSGIQTGRGTDEELGNGRHPLSALFQAGHGVLTQLRLISESTG